MKKQFKATAYRAKIFKVPHELGCFHVAGNTEGVIDFAVPADKKTYQLSLREARNMAEAIMDAAADVEANCSAA